MAQICSLLAHAYNYGVFILRGSSKGWGRREGEEGGGGWDSAFGHLFCSWAPVGHPLASWEADYI